MTSPHVTLLILGMLLPSAFGAEQPARPAGEPSAASTPGLTGRFMDFYARRLSNVDAVRSCRFVPTCGDYARQAIGKHGPLLGWIMGCERSIRWHGDRRTYRRALVDGHLRLRDPVADNDFWFPHPFRRVQPWTARRPSRAAR